NSGSACLRAVYQGTAVGKAGGPARDLTIRNLSNGRLSRAEQRRQLDLLAAVNAEQLKRSPGDSELEAVARSYELGWRMQTGAPDVLDLSREPLAVRRLYGIGEGATDTFGRPCLMARRLCEARGGYAHVTHGGTPAKPARGPH